MTYPITHWREATNWQKKIVPNDLQSWFFYPHSMTARMQCVCKTVEIDVLQHHIQIPTYSEMHYLKQPSQHYASLREIIMICDNEPWLFARTIIPLSTLKKTGNQLKNFGNKPIGKILFSNRSTTRSPYQFALINPEHFEFQRTKQATPINCNQLWARRSTFHISGKPLSLTEVFLPAMEQYIKKLTN